MLFVIRRLFFLLQSGHDFPLKNEGIHEGAEPMKPLMKTVFFISR